MGSIRPRTTTVMVHAHWSVGGCLLACLLDTASRPYAYTPGVSPIDGVTCTLAGWVTGWLTPPLALALPLTTTGLAAVVIDGERFAVEGGEREGKPWAQVGG